MATNHPTNVKFDKNAQFDYADSKIHRTFDPLIDQLIARRDALLKRVHELREDFRGKETTRIAGIKELEKVKKRMDDMNIKVNKNRELQQQVTQGYQEGLKKLEPSTAFQCPTFRHQRLDTIQTLISELGEIIQCEIPDYSLKKEPVRTTAGMRDACAEVLDPKGISFDECAELVYIADLGNSQVQIVTSNGGFVTEFGQQRLKGPWGIAVTDEWIFVTDTEQHAVFQFKKDLNFFNRTGTEKKGKGQLNYPRGLCIDTNGEVLVADSFNHRVAVFLKNLGFKSGIGVGQLQNPQDVKQTVDYVIVLDWSPKCVHFYSREEHYLSSCISQGYEQDSLMNTSSFFCLDSADSIIISDNDHHLIKIFGESGHHIHTFGKEGEEIGEFIRPCGVCVSKLGNIFVVSKNSNYPLQSF